jgi:hypothetical protein
VIMSQIVPKPYSMLIFMNPSLVFSIPWRPILLGPKVGVMIMLPPLFDRSPCDCPPIDGSLPVFPHILPSRCAGECGITGLLCTLTAGDTARRFSDISSKSSSRRRLFDFFKPSAAVGGYMWPGVDAREVHPMLSSLKADDSARANVGGGGV